MAIFRQQPMEWHGCPAATSTACWLPIALQSSVLNTGNLATILLRFSICMATRPYRHDGRDIDVGVLEMGQHGLRGPVLWRPIRRSRPTWSVHVSAALSDGCARCDFKDRGPR